MVNFYFSALVTEKTTATDFELDSGSQFWSLLLKILLQNNFKIGLKCSI